MSGNSDKAAGVTNEAMGKAKQGIGNVVGSDKMKSEGAAQELKGDAQKTTGGGKWTSFRRLAASGSAGEPCVQHTLSAIHFREDCGVIGKDLVTVERRSIPSTTRISIGFGIPKAPRSSAFREVRRTRDLIG